MPFLVASRRSKVRRVAIFLLVAVLVVFLIPPAQVALAAVWTLLYPDARSTLDPSVGKREEVFRKLALTGYRSTRFQKASSTTSGPPKIRLFSITKDPSNSRSHRWGERRRGPGSFHHQHAMRPLRISLAGAFVSPQSARSYYTVWMELFMSKQRILELYLNHIQFGPGIYGIGAAADHYFDKDPDQLTKPDDCPGGYPPQPIEVVAGAPQSDCSPEDSPHRAPFFQCPASARGEAIARTPKLTRLERALFPTLQR